MNDPLRSRINEIDAEFASFLAGRSGSWPLEDEWNPMSGIDYPDAVLFKERKRAESLKSWVWILAFASACLLVAFILTARSAMR